ncbi:MAG: hypothetical protein ACKO9H_20845, partial [Planctomycetota bacterium]
MEAASRSRQERAGIAIRRWSKTFRSLKHKELSGTAVAAGRTLKHALPIRAAPRQGGGEINDRPLTRGDAAGTLRVRRLLYPGLEAIWPSARRARYCGGSCVEIAAGAGWLCNLTLEQNISVPQTQKTER